MLKNIVGAHNITDTTAGYHEWRLSNGINQTAVAPSICASPASVVRS